MEFLRIVSELMLRVRTLRKFAKRACAQLFLPDLGGISHAIPIVDREQCIYAQSDKTIVLSVPIASASPRSSCFREKF